MDGPRDDHTKWSKSDKDNIIWYHSYVESNFKKMIQMSLFTKQKKTYRYWKQTYGYQRGHVTGREGGINQELGMNIHTLLYIR